MRTGNNYSGARWQYSSRRRRSTAASRDENRFTTSDMQRVTDRMIETARLWRRGAGGRPLSDKAFSLDTLVRSGISALRLDKRDCRDSELRWAEMCAAVIIEAVNLEVV